MWPASRCVFSAAPAQPLLPCMAIAVHGSRVLTWLLLFCNKRERPSACWEKACNVLHIYETGRTGGGDSGEQVDTGSLLQFMAQFSAALSPPTPAARAIWFLTQDPAARYLSMIKLVNSPCVIKCKVHANYDSVPACIRTGARAWCWVVSVWRHKIVRRYTALSNQVDHCVASTGENRKVQRGKPN